LAWWLRGTRFYQLGVLIGGSMLIVVLAATWLVERVFDIKLITG
jgi:hypothetical protein